MITQAPESVYIVNMDDGFAQTQALDFNDSEDETDDEAAPSTERPPAGYLKVLCQKGHPESSHPLYEGDNVIGRHNSCRIPLPFGSLSREHACIEVKGDSVLIYDKGSRNRTKRNKHFLQAEVRYELRDKDQLMFGDAECVFQAYHKDEGNESGSETGSESMFETAPIDQELDEATEERTLKLPVDNDDYQSDASSDILEPTQPFGSKKKNNNSITVDQNQTHNITVKDTPAPPRTKKITENLVLPESGSETDGEDDSVAAPTLAVESQHSDDEEDSPKRAILGAATQAYVCESDDETEEEVTPKKKALLMAATQAYVAEEENEEEEEEEDGDTPQKKSLLTAATQAYVGESDDETGDEDTPVKAKRAILAEPTQAYTMVGGIEPTMAYDMEDDESNDGVKEQEESAVQKKSLLFEPTQAYAGNVEDEDSNQGEEATNKKSLMFEPTQAYAGKADDEVKDDNDSETSEEFTLEDDDEDKDNDDEDVSHIFMAPTLACDDVEDSNQSEPSMGGIQEMETQAIEEGEAQAIGEGETQAVGDDQTQVVEEKDANPDDATQVFNDDATPAMKEKSKPKKIQADNDGETQVFTETQVLDEGKKISGDEPTQLVPDETQDLDETPEKNQAGKGGRASEEATQVFTDATLAVEEVEKAQEGKRSKTDDVDTDSEQATQVFTDATMAVEDMYHKNKVKKKDVVEQLDDSSEAATQVFDDAAVVNGTKRNRGKGSKKAKVDEDSKPATQVFDKMQEPSDIIQNEGKTAKGKAENEEVTQMFSQGVEVEDHSQNEIIIRAVATLAADEMDDASGTVIEKETSFGAEDATQVVEGTVPIGDMETQSIPGDVSDTVAVASGGTVSVTEPESTLRVTEVVEKSKAKGRGRKGAKAKSKVETDTEAATQVFGDAETLPITEVEEKPKARGRKAGKTKVDTSSEAATQVLPDTETLPIVDVEEKPKQKGRGRKSAKAETKTSLKTPIDTDGEAATQVLDTTETLPIVEVEEKFKSKGRGRKAAKSKTQEAVTNIDSEAATQVLDSTETLPISEVKDGEPKQRGRKRPAVPDMEPETQIYDDEKAMHTDDDAARLVLETEDVEDKPSKRSARNKKKETVQEVAKAGPSRKQSAAKVQDSKNNEPTAQTAGTRSRDRRGKQVGVDESSKAEIKSKPAVATPKKKKKAEEPVHEEATQAYSGEEATQRYGEEEKELSIEDDDLTPPLSEEVVPDSEDALNSPVIPAPPLVRIPSRSPHKSALSSPGRKKKSPSPKRVQFVSQGSQENETTTSRGRRGKKVAMVTAEAENDDSNKKESETQEKPTGRRGRRSVQVEVKTTEIETDKVKPGRKSLPAVFETDINDHGPSVGNDLDKDKLPKVRKGRNAKKSLNSVKDKEALLTSKVDNSSEPSEKANETVHSAMGKRTSRGKAASVKEKVGDKDKEIPETTVSENAAVGSKRQSSRSKSRQTEPVESHEVKGSRTKTSKSDEKIETASDNTEIPETSHRTRNKTKNDSQESDVVTSKRGTRKTASHENENLNKIEKTAEDKTDDTNKGQAKQQTKGKKSKGKSVSSESSETLSETSKVTEESVNKPRSKRKGKETESQDSHSNETVSNESKTQMSVINASQDTQTRTSKRKGRHEEHSDQDQKSDTTSKDDLKEITNLKNNKHAKETKASEKNKDKTKQTSTVVETGKVTRGKMTGPVSGSGDAHQVEPDHTPAKRRKTSMPESQTAVVTPKAAGRRATIANGATSKQNSEKATIGTPKGTSKLDNSLSSSPSLRKTDHIKPKVMFTGVTDEQSEKIVKELGGEMASSVYHCTHLVTDQVRRTVKFLCCLSRGIPICSPQWIMSSKRTSVFSDPSPFLISDHVSEKKFKFSLQLSLDKASEKLFLADYKIHVTKSVKPDPTQMKDIIQCAGAKYLGTIPKTYSDQTVVISCEEDKAACECAVKAGIPVVSSEFILTGALRQEADINSYRLFNGDKRKQSTSTDSEPSSKRRKK